MLHCPLRQRGFGCVVSEPECRAVRCQAWPAQHIRQAQPHHSCHRTHEHRISVSAGCMVRGNGIAASRGNAASHCALDAWSGRHLCHEHLDASYLAFMSPAIVTVWLIFHRWRAAECRRFHNHGKSIARPWPAATITPVVS